MGVSFTREQGIRNPQWPIQPWRARSRCAWASAMRRTRIAVYRGQRAVCTGSSRIRCADGSFELPRASVRARPLGRTRCAHVGDLAVYARGQLGSADACLHAGDEMDPPHALNQNVTPSRLRRRAPSLYRPIGARSHVVAPLSTEQASPNPSTLRHSLARARLLFFHADSTMCRPRPQGLSLAPRPRGESSVDVRTPRTKWCCLMSGVPFSTASSSPAASLRSCSARHPAGTKCLATPAGTDLSGFGSL